MKRILTLLFLLAVPALVTARLMQSWTYQEMFDRADLVAVAKPLTTKDTTETNTLPNLRSDLKVIGLATEFEIRTVMKGDKTAKKLVLHHYRLLRPDPLMMDGPNLAAFDVAQRNSFLLFLTKESDGRYAPVTGQVDPGVCSVLKLEGIAR